MDQIVLVPKSNHDIKQLSGKISFSILKALEAKLINSKK